MINNNSYRLVIQCELDGERRFIEFDTMNDDSIQSDSEITSHPMVNGDVVSDHSYRMPIICTYSGVFSLNGNKPTEFIGPFDRLTNLQNLFERIKNESVFCTLITLNKSNNKDSRFKTRENMVLKNIYWKNNQNSCNFTFTFQEVITANVVIDEFDVDVEDKNLPALTNPSTLDFTDTFIDWNEVDEMVIRQCLSIGVVTNEFLQAALDVFKSGAAGALLGAGIGLVIAGTTASTIAGILGLVGVSVSVPVVGLVIAGAALAVGAIIGIFKAIERSKKQALFKVQQFKKYKDDRKTQSEVVRFTEFVGEIHTQIEVLENVMQVYGIAKDENQECTTYIDDDYYTFSFIRNNNSLNYSLHISSTSKEDVYSKDEIQGLSNISECTDNNFLFRTTNGFYVYLMNLKYENANNNGASQKEIKEINQDLKNYAILVSQIKMAQFTTTLEDIIRNAITK